VNLPPAAEKCGEVTYTAPCPAGHIVLWRGEWTRQPSGKDVETLDFNCPVCP
jgi:hypothetical protein